MRGERDDDARRAVIEARLAAGDWSLKAAQAAMLQMGRIIVADLEAAADAAGARP